MRAGYCVDLAAGDGALAAALTGAAMVQVWWVQLLYKPAVPRNREATLKIGWHQDRHYWTTWEEGSELFTAWVALSPVAADCGPMKFVRGSHRWGLLDGARGEDSNIRMEKDVESHGTPMPVPLEPGGALFMSNLCVHTSKLNTTDECRWSIDYRYFPTPGRAALAADELAAAEFVRDKVIGGKTAPLIVLSEGHVPGWEEWEAEVSALRA